MSGSRPDRRLGQRYATHDATAAWQVPRRRWMRTRLESVPVTLVNVSTTGAAVVAETVPEFGRDSLVVIDCAGRSVEATIRRVVPGGSDGVSYYGLQFVDPDPAVLEVLMSRTDAETRAALEDYWNTAV